MKRHTLFMMKTQNILSAFIVLNTKDITSIGSTILVKLKVKELMLDLLGFNTSNSYGCKNDIGCKKKATFATWLI